MESKCKNCYLYILNTLADWEIGYLTAELNSGRYLDNTSNKPSLIKIGNGLKPVTTMGGIDITPDKDINDIKFQENDLLILPGADTWKDENNQEILNKAIDIINKDVIIAAICGATAALADKGLLNNRKHTSNSLEFLKMFVPSYTGDNYYVNEPAVTDGNLTTASSFSSLEFTYEVLKSIEVMKNDTLEAWFMLYKTRETNYFFKLMENTKVK